MPETDTMTERQFFAASDSVEIAYYIDDFTDPWKQSQTLFITHPAMSSARRLFAFVPHLARHYIVSCGWTCAATAVRRCHPLICR